MKKFVIMAALLCCLCFPPEAISETSTADVNTLFEELKADLQNKIPDMSLIDNASQPIKDLLGQGIDKEQLEKFLLDLYNKGMDKASFKNSVDILNELVKEKKERNLVSSSIEQAEEQGLKGRELKEKVREAIDQRKSQLEEMKKEALTTGQKIREDLGEYAQDAYEWFMDLFKKK